MRKSNQQKFWSILFLLIMVSSHIGQAQTGCLTLEPTDSAYQAIPWYGDENNYTKLDKMYDSLLAIYDPGDPLLRSVEEPLLRVPVKFFVYQVDANNPGGNDSIPDERRFQLAMDDANKAFKENGINIRFFIYEIKPISAPKYVVLNGIDERKELALLHWDYLAMNVHVVDEGGDVVDPWNNAVFMNRFRFRTENLAKTFTHETGHYFGLLHTHVFHNIPCLREPVSRGLKPSVCPPFIPMKRCAFTGDLLCDTPADPKMDDHGTQAASPVCTWNGGGLTDAYGDTYNPLEDNYMSYGDDACVSSFTEGQKKYITVWAFRFKDAVLKGWLPGANDNFDIYEPDNEAIAARLIEPGQTQNHTFHKKGREDVDWLVFTVPSCGLTKDVSFIVTDLTSNVVDEVAFFERGVDNNAGAELTATENNGTFTLAAGNLLPGLEYLVRITKDTDNSEYSVKYLFTNSCVFGPSVVCNTNTTFSISQRPAGSTITWDRSPNLTYVSGQGTNSFVVKTTALQAAAWVQPKITISGTQYSLPKKHVWAGPPLQAHNSDIYAVGYQDQNPHYTCRQCTLHI